MNLQNQPMYYIISSEDKMSLINDAYALIKVIKEMADKSKSAKMQSKVLELQAMFFELKEENDGLKQKIKNLTNETKFAKQMVLTDRGYYLFKEVKYCAPCWQKSKKTISLHTRKTINELLMITDTYEEVKGEYICPVCKTIYVVKE